MPLGQTAIPVEPAAVSAAEVGRLLASNPVAAEARAREILKIQPQNADASLVLGAALRRQGKAAEARTILEPIVEAQPHAAFAQLELGLTFRLLGIHAAALSAFSRAVDFGPTFLNAWSALGDELAAGEHALQQRSGNEEARSSLKAAEAAMTSRNIPEAETLLAQCVERFPDWQPGRFRYAILLLAEEKAHLALPQIDNLIHQSPAIPFYRELRASAQLEAGAFREAIAQYKELLDDGCPRPGAWISYGRALRSIGRQEEALAAFWKSIEVLPQYAEAYRTLATVKSIRLGPAVIDRLRALLARPGLLIATRVDLHFALAKALEDAGRNAEAFENYEKSQELQVTGVSGTGRGFQRYVEQLKAVFTPEFMRARSGTGSSNNSPIFVVGMPRSGSTLVQEILAAHSSIEGTGEIRALMVTVNNLRRRARGASFPAGLPTLSAEIFKAMGDEYLERARTRRKRGLPFFVDKYLQNFVYAGLIHLILPNARIVDVRRHPLDCCVSCFTNYFPEGPAWSHSLDDLGHFYAGYVALMEHFDAVLPGRVHRLNYEDLIEDPEREVRRLFAYLGLPYEEQCLRYYESEQAILTTSVEQARQPIYRNGIGGSRKYEPWLGALKAALAPDATTRSA